MATIIATTALSGGSIASSTISNVQLGRIQWKVTGVTDETKKIRVFPKVRLASDLEWVPIARDGEKYAVYFDLYGNQEFSRNLGLINAAEFKIDIESEAGMDGSIRVDAYTT